MLHDFLFKSALSAFLIFTSDCRLQRGQLFQKAVKYRKATMYRLQKLNLKKDYFSDFNITLAKCLVLDFVISFTLTEFPKWEISQNQIFRCSNILFFFFERNVLPFFFFERNVLPILSYISFFWRCSFFSVFFSFWKKIGKSGHLLSDCRQKRTFVVWLLTKVQLVKFWCQKRVKWPFWPF